MVSENRSSDNPPKDGKKQEINLDALPSAQRIEGKKQSYLGSSFAPKIVDRGPGKPPVQIKGSEIEIDSVALEQQIKDGKENLINGINSGNEGIVNRYLWYIGDRNDPEAVAAREALLQALKDKDASQLQLDALSINLPHRQIAEIDLIKKGLKGAMPRLPITKYHDDDGNELEENDLDYVMVDSGKRKDIKKGFVIMVGSKKGISGMTLPNEFPEDKFQPQKDKISKDSRANVITIPLNKATDGTECPFVAMEIYKDAVDLKTKTYQEEEDERQAPEPDFLPPMMPRPRSSPPRSVNVSN